MQASDGKLYGMTLWRKQRCWVIFSFDPSTSTYTKLKDFDDTNGAILWQPNAGKRWKAIWHDSAGGSSNGGMVLFFPLILPLPLIQS
jgi:hypothetical protein